MKITKEQQQILEIVFAHNPEAEVMHLTSDNQAFTESAKADSHSQRLGDEKVLTVTRSAFEAGEAPLVTDRAQEAGEGKIKGEGEGEAEVEAEAEVKVDDEKTALQAKYLELFGKKANRLTGVEKLKTQIAEKEAEEKK